jgi:hypothetical protein
MMYKILTIGFLAVFISLSSCDNQEQKKETVAIKNELPKPFKSMEKIEVMPGLIFDIINWGRGADSLSNVLILQSDSIKNRTSAYQIEIDGKLIETFNTDMDNDGNPEIIIFTTANKKHHPAEVYCLEYNRNEPSRIRFPDLSDKTSKQYKGNDKFYVKGGKLMREFDLFENLDDSNAKPIDRKVIQYSLKSNNFDITEMKK